MAIDETRLANAIIKINGKIDTTEVRLRKFKKALVALKSIRRNVQSTDIDGNPITTIITFPIDDFTEATISPARRQEIFDKIVSKVEALP